MQPINLRELAGKRFKVEFEESYPAQYGDNGRTDDPWLMIVAGKYGHVYPHSGHLLAASSDCRGPVSHKLARLPGAIMHQDAEDGVTVLFSPRLLSKVAKILRLRRRRRISDSERQRLAAMGAEFLFRSRGAGVNTQRIGEECDPTAEIDQSH